MFIRPYVIKVYTTFMAQITAFTFQTVVTVLIFPGSSISLQCLSFYSAQILKRNTLVKKRLDRFYLTRVSSEFSENIMIILEQFD